MDVEVIRGGTKVTIRSEKLLPGDVYIVQDNKPVPSDSILLYGQTLVNEAMLTGESIPVPKFSLERKEGLIDI